MAGSCLPGIAPDEMAMLDAATRTAETVLADMVSTLDEVNRKAVATFPELSALRGDRETRASAKRIAGER